MRMSECQIAQTWPLSSRMDCCMTPQPSTSSHSPRKNTSISKLGSVNGKYASTAGSSTPDSPRRPPCLVRPVPSRGVTFQNWWCALAVTPYQLLSGAGAGGKPKCSTGSCLLWHAEQCIPRCRLVSGTGSQLMAQFCNRYLGKQGAATTSGMDSTTMLAPPYLATRCRVQHGCGWAMSTGAAYSEKGDAHPTALGSPGRTNAAPGPPGWLSAPPPRTPPRPCLQTHPNTVSIRSRKTTRLPHLRLYL